MLKRALVTAVAVAALCATAAATTRGAPEDPPPTDALVGEIHATAYRWAVGSDVWRVSDCVIPLKARVTRPNPEKPLGVLHGKRGGTAEVYVATNQPAGDALVCEVRNAGPAGDYTGVLKFRPDEEKEAPFTLSLAVKDEVVLPIVVLALSTWLALFIKRYVGVLRGMWTLRQREASVALEFARSEAMFAAAARGHPYASCSIAQAFKTARLAVASELDRIQRESGLAIDTTTAGYKDVIQQFERLERIAASWGTLAQRLARIENLRASVVAAEDQLPDVTGPDRVKIIETMTALLEQSGFADLKEYEDFETRLPAEVSFAQQWLDLAERITGAWTWADQLERESALTQDEKREISDVRKRTGAAGEGLRRGNAGDLAPLQVDVAGIERTLGQIGTRPPMVYGDAATRILRTFTTWNDASSVEIDVRASQRVPTEPPEDPAARLDFYRQRQRVWDLRIGLIAVVVALLTGLQKNYFDKPFGSAGDYIGLLLVGLATRAAVDALATAFEWYHAGRGPEPRVRSAAQ